MNRKAMGRIAVFMVVVFIAIVVVYPMLFGPNKSELAQPLAPSAMPSGAPAGGDVTAPATH